MTTPTLCTLVNRGYLTRGLALHEALARHRPDAELFVLCLDGESHRVLSGLALRGLRLVPHTEFEDDTMRALRAERSEREYCFTCTASFSRWLMRNRPEIELLAFVDADTWFFADPEPLFEELGEGSIGITEHRFPEAWRHHEEVGIYNAGWACFRRDENGLRCLDWWHERCLEWCYDRIEDGRYAEQKYIERFADLFRGVVVLRHKGANVAPWNVPNYRIHREGGRVLIDEDPLIFYHFCGVRKPAPGLYNSSVSTPISTALRKDVYGPYIEALHRWRKVVDRASRTGAGEKLRRLFPGVRTTIKDLAAGEKLLVAPWGRVL